MRERHLKARYLRTDIVLVGPGKELLSELHVELSRRLIGAKRPSEAYLGAVEGTLTLIIANLVAASQSGRDWWVHLPVGRSWYADNSKWLRPMTSNSTKAVRDFLLAKGFIERDGGIAEGRRDRRRPQSIRSTPLLAELFASLDLGPADIVPGENTFTVRLKGPKRRIAASYIDFEETEETARMRSDLTVINNALMGHWADIQLTNRQFREMLNGRRLQAEAARKDQRSIDQAASPPDFSRRTLHRIFNNGTFEQGGRFYGGWWQNIPTKYRPFITIDGQRTVELDFSAFHPTVLYAEVGISKPDDPYDIGMFDRKVVKRTFNALINAGGHNIEPVDGFTEEAASMSWSVFLRRVKHHFAPFKGYFGASYGLRLQRLDSDVAERCLLHFAKQGEAILPLHDSFIAPIRLANELESTMRRAFSEIAKATTGIRSEALDAVAKLEIERTIESKRQLLRTRGLTEHVANAPETGPYGSYNRRLRQWNDRRPAHPS